MCMAHAKAVNIDSSGNYTPSEDLDNIMHIMHVYTHLQQYQLTTISKLRVYML